MRHKVPQINKKTKVADDYINGIGGLFTRINLFGKMDSMSEEKRGAIMSLFNLEDEDYFFKEIKIKKYRERYSSGEYENVVNDENRVRVRRLDSLVDSINGMIEEESCDADLMLRKLRGISYLIYGEKPSW